MVTTVRRQRSDLCDLWVK